MGANPSLGAPSFFALPLADHAEILLIRTKGIAVMLTDYGFYSIRVGCFNRCEDLPVLFLGLREAVSENLF
jgi:hypothetical protein